MNPLTAISPIDGRYRSKVDNLSNYFSEYALIKYRVLVEIEYFLALTEQNIEALADFPEDKEADLRNIYLSFTEEDAQKIKDIEKVTNHDVKAVEYFIKEKLAELGLSQFEEFIHFGLTSQDINNTAVPLSMKHALYEEYIPLLDELIQTLNDLAQEWKEVPMLARTHGQPASPTRLGKEIFVFVERLDIQKGQLLAVPFSAKFGGATGNMNAHFVAFPKIEWVDFANNFVNTTLQIERSQTTTQIEHYDNAAALFDAMKRINNIILDLDRDMWTYISMEYFKQKIKEGEIGSSAMPHKVNPIDFENSEGNLGISNALFEHLAAKLPVSRLQRDLTDSTVLRNVGVPIAHSVLAIKSTLKGLSKVLLNEGKLNEDLEENWAVVAEAIQTVLRREGFPKPYEALKGLTRTNSVITQQSISEFIDTLDVSAEIKEELRAIRPQNFTGINMMEKG
ncbi:MAG: adenylosuccinate lyase [Flavobacteriales bacterium]|nr:adenylosuccinate lyase [Flavobacteriales bacterium]